MKPGSGVEQFISKEVIKILQKLGSNPSVILSYELYTMKDFLIMFLILFIITEMDKNLVMLVVYFSNKLIDNIKITNFYKEAV